MSIMSIVIGFECTQVAISKQNHKQVLCFRYGDSTSYIALKNTFSLFEDDYSFALNESRDKTTALDLAVFITHILLIIKKSFGVFGLIRIAVEPDYLFLQICDAIPLIINLFDAFKEKSSDDFCKTKFADLKTIALTESANNPSFCIHVFDALEIRLGMLSKQMEGCGVLALAEVELSETRVHLFLPSNHKVFCLGSTTIDIGIDAMMCKGVNRDPSFSFFAEEKPSTIKVSGLLKSELQDRIAYAIAKMWKGKDFYGEGVATFYYNDLDIYLPVGCIAFVGVGATIAGMTKSYRRLLSISSSSSSINIGEVRTNQGFALNEWMPFISLPLALLVANVPLQEFKHEMKRSELRSTIRFNAWIHEQSKKEQSGKRDDVNYEHGLTQL